MGFSLSITTFVFSLVGAMVFFFIGLSQQVQFQPEATCSIMIIKTYFEHNAYPSSAMAGKLTAC